MAVIGTVDEIIFARIGDDVWKVVVGLSRDVDIVSTQAVLRNRTGAAEGAADRFMNYPRHPLSPRSVTRVTPGDIA